MPKSHTDIGMQVVDVIALIRIIVFFIFLLSFLYSLILLKSSRPRRTPNSALTTSGSSSVPVEMSGCVRSGSGTHSRWPL